jgi:hypothetical protein
VHDSPEVVGKLEFVPRGVQRLREWTGGKKPVWNCIECTHIGGKDSRKATPEQVRSEVWMSLIQGSQGIIYFVHQFEPTFREAALLDDPEMLKAVTALNQEIKTLAPVLNSPTLDDKIEAKTSKTDALVKVLVKEYGGHLYVFAAEMRGRETDCVFRSGLFSGGIEALGESRNPAVANHAFTEHFKPYGIHLYRSL